MAIKKIKVENFKTFEKLDLELGNFNVIIGANASGKSNFTQIFRFLKDIEGNDLRNAISMNGGLEHLRNLKIGNSRDMHIEIELDLGFGATFPTKDKNVDINFNRIEYRFAIGTGKPKNGFKITDEQFIQRFEIVKPDDKKELFKDSLFKDSQELNEGLITVSKIGSKVDIKIEPAGLMDKIIWPALTIKEFASQQDMDGNSLLIQQPYLAFLVPPWKSLLDASSIYNIDPRAAKNPVTITGRADLEENASNLALILNGIIEDKEKKRKLRNLLGDVLPFVEDVGTEKFAEKSLQMTLHENYYSEDLTAGLLSDGTVNIAALIVILYFENRDIIFLEEPERSIHPYLISKMMDMVKDASENKQIIITTHSPEVVKHAGLENLLLVSRDKDGFSTISRPSEKEEVKVFLKNELGLDELYVQNLLTE